MCLLQHAQEIYFKYCFLVYCSLPCGLLLIRYWRLFSFPCTITAFLNIFKNSCCRSMSFSGCLPQDNFLANEVPLQLGMGQKLIQSRWFYFSGLHFLFLGLNWFFPHRFLLLFGFCLLNNSLIFSTGMTTLFSLAYFVFQSWSDISGLSSWGKFARSNF